MNDILQLPIKKYVIIGGRALGVRQTKDIDVICHRKDIDVKTTSGDDYLVSFEFNGNRIECLLADKMESLQQILNSYLTSKIAFPVHQWVIKKGHIVYESYQTFDKHIHDIAILKRICEHGPHKDLSNFDSLVKLHRKCTRQMKKIIKTPKLTGVSKDAFFDDYVDKYYEHDFLHECVAHKERPMFSYMQKDSTEVTCHKDMWDTFTHQEKIWCVLEESYVIAIERFIVPQRIAKKPPIKPIIAFKQALYKICTTLCSGWFREFAIDNYYEIFNSHNKNFVNDCFKKIEQHTCM